MLCAECGICDFLLESPTNFSRCSKMDSTSLRPLSAVLTLLFVVFTVSTTLVTAQSFSFGKCTKTLPVQDNFSFEPFVGTWYEEWRVYHLPEAPFQCVFNEVGREDNNGNYNFTVDGGWIIFGKKIYTKLGGHITPSKESNAKWNVHLANFIPHDPYWVLQTDYKTFALSYSCEQAGPLKMEIAWILRRDPHTPLDPALVEDLKNYFVFNGINDYTTKWVKVKNDNCNFTSSKAGNDQQLL